MMCAISNSIQKEVKLLHKRKNRDERKLFFIEGIRFVKEAIQEDINIKYIIISDKLKDDKEVNEILKNAKVNIYIATDKIIKELSDTDTPQGIIAVIPYLQFLDDTKDNKNNTYLILDSVQDPGNMGTIIRTADATGVNKIILSKGCVDIYNPKVLRATMGSIFRTNIVLVDELRCYIRELKNQNFMVFAAHLGGVKNYFEVNLKNNVAIVIGNEANGIREEVANECSGLIKIPMLGKIESLNAGVSASVILYEILRQKQYVAN